MRTKLLGAALIIASAMGYMAYVGAAASWQYYLTTDECVAQSATLGTARIRVNGTVAPSSLAIDEPRHQARFALAGTRGNLPVVCATPLPDNFKEGMSVVAEGRLDDAGCLRGEKILTRCASKYQTQADERSAAAAASGGAKEGP